jgi:predicted DsbA family dithiol-disulfide isomerase
VGDGEGDTDVSYAIFDLVKTSYECTVSSFRGVMSQSTLAHRLARKAYVMGGQKLQVPVLCGIFKANLEEAKDIGDVNVLAEVAESVGMMSKDEASCSMTSF